jgi:hypothetical protein
MRLLLLVILVTGSFCLVSGQKADQAVATYSKNGRIIGVTNLSGLSDCASKSSFGTVSKVEIDGDVARVNLRDKKVDTEVNIPLGRVAPDDRKLIFRNFLSKKIKLRVAGYACKAEGSMTAFSVDRIY